MIDQVFWQDEICDLCRKDESLLQFRLAGIGFSLEKSKQAREIWAQWEQEIICPCVVFRADMESIIICEKHLLEILSKKKDVFKND